MNRTHALPALILCASALLAPAAQSAGGGLPDGEYDCGGGYTYRHMGKVDIRNDRFRYRPLDAAVNDFAPYSVDGNGMIHWGGPFRGLDDPPGRIVDSKRETWGFNVRYEANPGGSVNTMSCHAPGK